MATPLTVRIKPPVGEWVVCGTEDQKGYTPESFTGSANQWGSDTCGFNLRRDPKVPYLDLAPFSPCEVEVGGVVVWTGRVWETPAGGPYTIGLAGRGWQYHLDDDLTQKVYVHADLSAYVDQRSLASADPTTFTEGVYFNAPNTGSVIVLSAVPGATAVLGKATGVTLDLGSTQARRVSIDWLSSNNDASLTLYARAHTLPNLSAGTSYDAFTILLNSGASGTTSGTFVTGAPYRYVSFFLYVNAGHAIPATDCSFKITGARVYGQTAYESGGLSILHASDVVTAELANAPLLNQTDLTRISATSFAIPMLADPSFQTARTRMNAANAYHDWQLGIDVDRRLLFRAFPTTPLYEVAGGFGAEFTEAALNSGQDVYNKVIVQGSQPDGSAVLEVRTATSPLLNRQGLTRAFLLSVNVAITPAAADALGDAWLATRTRTPLSGSLSVTGVGGVKTMNGGQPIHPAQLLLACGERIRFSDRADPDDGSWGRDGTISTVTYSHDGEKADVAIDSPRDRLDALLAQVGAIEQAVGL